METKIIGGVEYTWCPRCEKYVTEGHECFKQEGETTTPDFEQKLLINVFELLIQDANNTTLHTMQEMLNKELRLSNTAVSEEMESDD